MAAAIPSAVHIAPDREATETCGQSLATGLAGGDVVLLEGPLAAGKTTLVRGLVRGLGGDPDEVSSPTFIIVQSYRCRGPIKVVHHIDLYRLPDNPTALREIGIEDVLADESAVVAVEWPRDLLTEWLPRGVRVWRVEISRLEADERRIEINAPGQGF